MKGPFPHISPWPIPDIVNKMGKYLLERFILMPQGYRITSIPEYDQDGLLVFNNCDFMKDPSFISAYARGIQAAGRDYKWHWRVYTGLWAASYAVRLPGAFVECGVYRGFLSSAIMQYLDWNQLDKEFYLFDTFCGLDPALLIDEEVANGRLETHKYDECYESVKDNFSEFHNVKLIRGSIPSTLTHVSIDSVCYLSIDMNCVTPEIAAIEFFWPKLRIGGVVLLDDYAGRGYEPQKEAMDLFAKRMGIHILSLPTGQGLIIKR
jgi:hypothetical protein